jgi:GNAT superfamily N-acetyltransferase
MNRDDWLNNLRWLPAAAAAIATVSDCLLLAAASRLVGIGWLWAGGVLGVVGIPVYALGYRLATRVVERWSGRGARVAATVGAAVAVLGAFIHGLTTWNIASDIRSGAPPLDPIAAVVGWGPLILVLWAVAMLFAVVASVIISWGAFRLGVWSLALTTPAVMTVVLGYIGLSMASVGDAFAASVPNLAHVIFFTMAALATSRRVGRAAEALPVQLAESDAEIGECYDVVVQLRSHITQEAFLPRVRAQEAEGYKLAYVRDAGRVIGVAGFRVMETIAWGRILYCDDLVTDEAWRSRGVGRRLIAWLKEQARSNGCDELHLDSGVQRVDAHRFYEREGLRKVAHHFRIRLDGE